MIHLVATASPLILYVLASVLFLAGFLAGTVLTHRSWRRRFPIAGFGSGVLANRLNGQGREL